MGINTIKITNLGNAFHKNTIFTKTKNDMN